MAVKCTARKNQENFNENNPQKLMQSMLKRKLFLLLTGLSLSVSIWCGCASTTSLSNQSLPASSSIDAIAISAKKITIKKLHLSDEEALSIGYRIWKNECNGNVEGLTTWNRGEEFASLGIGHFIWFPLGCKAPFGESFPRLVDFLLASEGGAMYIPEWLRSAFERGERSCPWRSREEFQQALSSEEMRELRTMLASTVSLQARYIANRMELSLQKILDAVPEDERSYVHRQFYRVAAAPMGLYVLADYVNFKGEGVRTSEEYGNHGWGLLQVLQGMNGTEEGKVALREFSNSAEARLTERVENAPPERNEHRWLVGWKRRLKTYLVKP